MLYGVQSCSEQLAPPGPEGGTMDKYRHQRSRRYALGLVVAWLAINVGMLLFQSWPIVMKAILGVAFIFVVIPLALGHVIRRNN